MEFRIADGIRRHLKKSYAIESEDLFADFDVDCGEGINTVMASERAREAFAGLNFAMAGPYPHSPALKDAVVAHAPRSSGQKGPERNNIVLCDGSVAGLYLVNRLFLEPGDRVLGYVPQFSEYETDVKMRGCLFDAVPLRAEDGYRFDPDAFIAALRPEHKLAYLDNPNNPTGQVIPLAAIEKILRAAAALNVAVLVDEAYGDYMAPECSALTLWGGHENLLVAKTFSKGFGLAGLRAGYLVLPDELARAAGNITNPYTVSALSRHVAARAVTDAAFLTALRDRTAAIKRELLRPWKRIAVACTEPTVSISLVTHADPSVDLAREFAKRRVLVISGSDFSGIGKNSVRFRVPAAGDMAGVLDVIADIDARV